MHAFANCNCFQAMLSAVPAIFPAETGLGIPPLDSQSSFMPWDSLGCYFSPFDHLQLESVMGLSNLGPGEPNLSPVSSDSGTDPSRYHAGLDSGSDGLNQNSVSSNDDPDEPKRNSVGLGSGTCKRRRMVSILEERKRRRMESNRESARRSRMRKRKHLENLRNQVNRLKLENRECMNRLGFVIHHFLVLQRYNDQLYSESVVLQSRLAEVRNILQLHQRLQQEQ
ncbi:hypothetical protein Ancab_025866 [Ancistrocladus abbreviatus]